MGNVLTPPAALILRSRGVLEDGFSSVFLRHTLSRGWRYLPVKYIQSLNAFCKDIGGTILAQSLAGH
jgi:hypothetical protein